MSELRAATINDCLRRLASERPDQEVIVTYNSRLERASLTAEELFTLASRFAKLLKDAGLRKGEFVVNALPNCLEETVTSFGVYLAGGINVAVEVFLNTGDTFFEVLHKTKARFLIAAQSESDMVWSLVKEGTKPGPGGCPVLHVTSSSRAPDLKYSLAVSRSGEACLLSLLREARETYVCYEVRPEDPCVVHTTASSTSFVCLVVHSHAAMVEGGLAARDVVSSGCQKLLYAKPPTWILSTPGMLLLMGVTRVRVDQWPGHEESDLYRLLAKVVEAEGIDMVFLLPTEAAKLVEVWSPRPLPMLTQFVVGAMPVTAKLVARVMPSCKVLTSVYASTEMQVISYNSITRADQFQDFDTGVHCTGGESRIVDSDFKVLSNGKSGLVLLKAAGMFLYYAGQSYKDSEVKQTEDGYFITGDAGCQRSDGHLLVMGRKDDMILHNVWNLHPSWIEKHIRTHPSIEKVTVVPIPDEENFQNICACVIRKTGKDDLSAEDVKGHFRANYVDEEKDSLCPTDVVFLESFPESRPGQVDRGKLAEIATDLVMKARVAIATAGVMAVRTIYNKGNN